MVQCCGFGCLNNDGKKNSSQKEVSWHMFPSEVTDKERRGRWISACQPKNWKPFKRLRLCSNHFKQNCFRYTTTSRCLKSDAVPTIFNVQDHLKRASPAKRKPPKDRSSLFGKIQKQGTILLLAGYIELNMNGNYYFFKSDCFDSFSFKEKGEK